MKCPNCGVEFPGELGDECPRCHFAEQVAEKQAPGLPWAERREIGFVSALWETAKLMLFSPTLAVGRMKGGVGRHGLYYYWIMCTMAVAVNTLVFLIPGASMADMPSEMLMLPVLASLALVGWSIIGTRALHICSLMLRRHASKALSASLFYYAVGSCMIFCMVPAVGWLVGTVYAFVLVVIGVKHMHRTNTIAAVAVVLASCGLSVLIWWLVNVACLFGLALARTLAR